MVTTLALAEAALSGDALRLRSLVQDLMSTDARLADLPRPATSDALVLATAAALVELLAERAGQPAPAWAADIGPAPVPTHLLRSAQTMKRLRTLCEEEAPLPLRRRRLYAPPNYLVVA